MNAQYYLSIQNASISIVIDTNQKNHLTLHLNLRNGVPNDTFYIQQSFKENPGYLTTRAKGKFYEGILIDSMIVYNNRGQITEKGFFRGLYTYNGDTHPDKLDTVKGYGKYGMMGYRHGKFTFYESGKNYTNYKKVSEIDYVDGFKQGKKIHYHPDGTIHTSETYFRDTLHGESYENYSDGVLKMKENYNEGKRDGLCQWWYPNGKLSDSLFFKNGKLHGKVVSYYSDGKKKSIQNYVDYEWHGESWEWYHNGQLKWYSVYNMGERIGDYQYYDSLGKKQRLWPSSGSVGVINGQYLLDSKNTDFKTPTTLTTLALPQNLKKNHQKLLRHAKFLEFECKVVDKQIVEVKITKDESGMNDQNPVSEKNRKKLIGFIQQNVATHGVGFNGEYYDGTLRFKIHMNRHHIW